MFLSDEGPKLETLDFTIRIGSVPTFFHFDLYLTDCLRSTLHLFQETNKHTFSPIFPILPCSPRLPGLPYWIQTKKLEEEKPIYGFIKLEKSIYAGRI